MAKRKSPVTAAAKAAQQSFEEVARLVDEFCRKHLNDEYATLCRELTEKLARKRPSPLGTGKAATWACGIVRTIGWVNYLDNRKEKPHMKLTAIDKVFGVAESTAQQKSALIRKMFRITPSDPEWSLPSQVDKNPRSWMIQMHGFIVDARILKREFQEEAFRKGLIPFIPADQAKKTTDE